MKGIITLCGSTKFKKYFELVNKCLTLDGYIVLSVGSFHHDEGEGAQVRKLTEQNKDVLDELHKEKIALAWAVFFINPGGYMGESTKSELVYASALGKELYYWARHEMETNDLERLSRTFRLWANTLLQESGLLNG